MRLGRRRLALAALACLAACRPRAAPSPPAVAADRLLRPAFATRDGELRAGSAFLVRDPRAPASVLLLTAHHLFGPDGGLAREVAGAELPAFVREVRLADLAGRPVAVAGPVVPIPGARAHRQVDFAHDLAAFAAPPALAGRAFALARAAPAVGERVWLFAEVRAGAPPGRLLHAATVTSSSATELAYRFDDGGLDLGATSGAPVLDGAGEVVGVHLGGGRDLRGLFGVANPAASVRALIGG